MSSPGVKRPKTADQLVHELIRDRMTRHDISRQDMASALMRGAHDLELRSTPAEKDAAAIFMRHLADHLVAGGGWYLWRAGLEVPFAIDGMERAQRSGATARETPGRIALNTGLDIIRLGLSRAHVVAGFREAADVLEGTTRKGAV